MLGLGWTEMLLIAALALIVVGPRDLPVMLRQLGRAFGIMRRMGNEFKSEFNKMAAIDEIKDVRKSLTDPLRNAQAEIQREFNKTTATGVQPSGALKPDAGDGESVVGAIKTQAGMNASSADEAMSAALAQSRAKVSDTPPAELAGDTGETAAKTARKPRSKTASAKTASAKSAAAKTDKPAASKPAAKSAAKSTAKPRAASKPAAEPESGEAAKPAKAAAKPASAASKSTARKAPAKPARPTEDKPAAKSAAKPKSRAARKPAAAKSAAAKATTAKRTTAKPAAAKSDSASGAKSARSRAASKTEKA